MSARLDRYKAKRDFGKTPEPSEPGTSGEGIYVIQKHRARRLHYDLRLEFDGVLLSWAIPKEPTMEFGVKRLAVHVEDHPLSYSDFEGEIPAGEYGAGSVEIWDRGTWTPLVPVEQGLRDGNLKFELRGERLHGRWVLVRMGKPSDKENWLWIREKPPGLKSVKPAKWTQTGLPSFELCTLRTSLPEENGWQYEIKWDGYRAFGVAEDDEPYFSSRGGNRIALPHLEEALLNIGEKNLILDGELIALGEDGKPDFNRLQKALKGEPQIVNFVAFDLLRIGEEDLRGLPLSHRFARLKELVPEPFNHPLFLSLTLDGEDPGALLDSTCKSGFEGIIAKKLSSRYTGKRSLDWIKVKCGGVGNFEIVGYKLVKGSSNHIGSLLLAQKTPEGLEYRGKVGTGFTDALRSELFQLLQPLRVAEAPLKVARKDNIDVFWVNPELAAKVRFVEITNAGSLRHSSFLGLVPK
ncbi:MAG: non-homologous end-joining DNA ligase [Fimbriimonadaceae bacterium]